jgi:hypothetical protein
MAIAQNRRIWPNWREFRPFVNLGEYRFCQAVKTAFASRLRNAPH